MQAFTAISQLLGTSDWAGQVKLRQDPSGTISIAYWASTLTVAQPTAAAFAALLAQPEPMSSLASDLVSAASSACDAITIQIATSQTRSSAYTIAYNLVGPSATVPSSGAAQTTFANMAAAYGMTPQQFATLVANIALAPLQLATALAALETSVAAAKAASDLAAALSSFETSLVAVVTALNASGVTSPVQAPAPITIPGISA